MDNTEKIWACEWTGPRGGKKWTGWVSESAARDTFERYIGEKHPACLVKRSGLGGFTISSVVERNKVQILQHAEVQLKNRLKERTKINKSIMATRQKIKELKAEIKTMR